MHASNCSLAAQADRHGTHRRNWPRAGNAFPTGDTTASMPPVMQRKRLAAPRLGPGAAQHREAGRHQPEPAGASISGIEAREPCAACDHHESAKSSVRIMACHNPLMTTSIYKRPAWAPHAGLLYPVAVNDCRRSYGLHRDCVAHLLDRPRKPSQDRLQNYRRRLLRLYDRLRRRVPDRF